MRMGQQLFRRAGHGAAEPGIRQGGFQIFRIPAHHRLCNARAIIRHIQDIQNAVPQFWVAAMKEYPPVVARQVIPRGRVVRVVILPVMAVLALKGDPVGGGTLAVPVQTGDRYRLVVTIVILNVTQH